MSDGSLGPSSGSGGGSSGASGGSGRRLISEFPPHIQQLLDQQDRQGFERGSPLRRPVYRKVVAGSGIAPSIQYDGSLPTYLLPGTAAVHVMGQAITLYLLPSLFPLSLFSSPLSLPHLFSSSLSPPSPISQKVTL